MGCCMGASREPSVRVGSTDQFGNSVPGVAIGRNQPLKKDKLEWTSDIPLTDGQLRSKRDEFWETAPAFDGRKEIWDALRAACETDDHGLAQAILDGANITLPTGQLTDAYDELGNRYVLPLYCVCKPTNLISDDDLSNEDQVDEDDEKNGTPIGEEIPIKFRLSTGKDIKVTVYKSDTVGRLKKRLTQTENIELSHQRWFYAGKLLSDKITIEDTKILKGNVIQVIITTPPSNQ